MPIADTDIKFRKSAVTNNTTSNGGRMSVTVYPTSNNNGPVPVIDNELRTAGGDRYRKVHIHFSTATNIEAIDPDVFVALDSTSTDAIMFFAGDFDNTQADITGSERLYGLGDLDASATAGDSSIDVATKGAAFAIFQPSDKIRIAEGATVEYVSLTSATIAYAGDVATLALDGTLANNFTTAAVVSSVYEPGDTQANTSSWAETTVSGTYDETTYPLTLRGDSTVYDVWTLTFSDATNFSVAGAATGSVGSGTIGGNFAPTNSDYGQPYFTLLAAGWGGTWAAAETIVFTTEPNAIPIWVDIDVPAGIATGSLIPYQLRCETESDT